MTPALSGGKETQMTDEDKIKRCFEDYLTAFRAGDAEACGRSYADNAEYLACGIAPLRGRQAIVSLHADILRQGDASLELETDELHISGDLAYLRQTIKTGSGTSIALLVLRRGSDGDWLVHAEAEVPL